MNAIVVVDGAQGIVHEPVDDATFRCWLYVFSGLISSMLEPRPLWRALR
ncbi:aminotransferase class V-fold PLP-dependent enzyme [Vibrio lentus]|nr:aminotransferase class V-fold PLP-dependent enzyme [Vibrio lentus]